MHQRDTARGGGRSRGRGRRLTGVDLSTGMRSLVPLRPGSLASNAAEGAGFEVAPVLTMHPFEQSSGTSGHPPDQPCEVLHIVPPTLAALRQHARHLQQQHGLPAAQRRLLPLELSQYCLDGLTPEQCASACFLTITSAQPGAAEEEASTAERRLGCMDDDDDGVVVPISTVPSLAILRKGGQRLPSSQPSSLPGAVQRKEQSLEAATAGGGQHKHAHASGPHQPPPSLGSDLNNMQKAPRPSVDTAPSAALHSLGTVPATVVTTDAPMPCVAGREGLLLPCVTLSADAPEQDVHAKDRIAPSATPAAAATVTAGAPCPLVPELPCACTGHMPLDHSWRTALMPCLNASVSLAGSDTDGSDVLFSPNHLLHGSCAREAQSVPLRPAGVGDGDAGPSPREGEKRALPPAAEGPCGPDPGGPHHRSGIPMQASHRTLLAGLHPQDHATPLGRQFHPAKLLAGLPDREQAACQQLLLGLGLPAGSREGLPAGSSEGLPAGSSEGGLQRLHAQAPPSRPPQLQQREHAAGKPLQAHRAEPQQPGAVSAGVEAVQLPPPGPINRESMFPAMGPHQAGSLGVPGNNPWHNSNSNVPRQLQPQQDEAQGELDRPWSDAERRGDHGLAELLRLTCSIQSTTSAVQKQQLPLEELQANLEAVLPFLLARRVPVQSLEVSRLAEVAMTGARTVRYHHSSRAPMAMAAAGGASYGLDNVKYTLSPTRAGRLPEDETLMSDSTRALVHQARQLWTSWGESIAEGVLEEEADPPGAQAAGDGVHYFWGKESLGDSSSGSEADAEAAAASASIGQEQQQQAERPGRALARAEPEPAHKAWPAVLGVVQAGLGPGAFSATAASKADEQRGSGASRSRVSGQDRQGCRPRPGVKQQASQTRLKPNAGSKCLVVKESLQASGRIEQLKPRRLAASVYDGDETHTDTDGGDSDDDGDEDFVVGKRKKQQGGVGRRPGVKKPRQGSHDGAKGRGM